MMAGLKWLAWGLLLLSLCLQASKMGDTAQTFSGGSMLLMVALALFYAFFYPLLAFKGWLDLGRHTSIQRDLPFLKMIYLPPLLIPGYIIVFLLPFNILQKLIGHGNVARFLPPLIMTGSAALAATTPWIFPTQVHDLRIGYHVWVTSFILASLLLWIDAFSIDPL